MVSPAKQHKNSIYKLISKKNHRLEKVSGSITSVMLRNALRNISQSEFVLYKQNPLILHLIKKKVTRLKKRISQRDIAKILGINVSTVSRALKGQGGVSSALRQRIEQLAHEQRYRPNPFAVSLRFDTTRTIGIVVPDVSYNPYAHFVKRVESEARKAGLLCIIMDSNDSFAGEVECLEHLESMHVEGIILCLSQETTDFSHLERLKRNHMPLVLFDRIADIDVSSVVINDELLARQATLHLIDGGARRIAFLGGPNQLKQTVDRKHGYIEALHERGLAVNKELVMCNNISFNSGLSDALELLSLPEPPDAIVAAHGLLTTSSIQAVTSKGLRIPEDVSIIGFMSDWVSDISNPRMTFVKQNLKELGTKAFKLLQDQINGDEEVYHVVANARLEVRESTRKVC
jgi:LacI family transcriptional regulator